MTESPDHVTCLEVVNLVTDYLEGDLDPALVELLEQHVNYCEGCDSYVEQMRIVVDTVGRSREEDVPPETLDRLLGAFREWKRS